jgi:hypothetical protein
MNEADIIIQEWGLDASGLHTREDILAALARRIGDMLLQDPMGFIQLMYRLDIPEAQLDMALDHAEAASLIAQLVWNRQVQKIALRQSTPPKNAEDDDLDW